MAKKVRKSIEYYQHINNPPTGLVMPCTDPQSQWAGTVERASLSLPFDLGKNQRVVVKIVDDFEIEGG